MPKKPSTVAQAYIPVAWFDSLIEALTKARQIVLDSQGHVLVQAESLEAAGLALSEANRAMVAIHETVEAMVSACEDCQECDRNHADMAEEVRPLVAAFKESQRKQQKKLN